MQSLKINAVQKLFARFVCIYSLYEVVPKEHSFLRVQRLLKLNVFLNAFLSRLWRDQTRNLWMRNTNTKVDRFERPTESINHF